MNEPKFNDSSMILSFFANFKRFSWNSMIFPWSPNRSEFEWFFKGCGNPVPSHGYGYQISEKMLKSTKAAEFRACIIGKGCTQMISSLKVTIIARPPTAPRVHIGAFHTCFLAFAVSYAGSLATTAGHIYVKTVWSWQSSHGGGQKGWGWVWDTEQLIRSIETSTFYLNASNYHLIDIATLTDTRCSHMVFLTKLTD